MTKARGALEESCGFERMPDFDDSTSPDPDGSCNNGSKRDVSPDNVSSGDSESKDHAE